MKNSQVKEYLFPVVTQEPEHPVGDVFQDPHSTASVGHGGPTRKESRKQEVLRLQNWVPGRGVLDRGDGQGRFEWRLFWCEGLCGHS